MGAQPPILMRPPSPPKSKNAESCEPVQLETLFNDQKMQK